MRIVVSRSVFHCFSVPLFFSPTVFQSHCISVPLYFSPTVFPSHCRGTSGTCGTNREIPMTIHHLRRDYRYGSLTRDELPSDPIALFQTWFSELRGADLPEWFEPNAMTVATHKSTGGAACRIVLLKEVEPDGFLFFTNYQSSKGMEIDADGRVALGFYWPILDRQVRVEGIAERVDPEISERYFRSRPRSSQLSANVSPRVASRNGTMLGCWNRNTVLGTPGS